MLLDKSSASLSTTLRQLLPNSSSNPKSLVKKAFYSVSGDLSKVEGQIQKSLKSEYSKLSDISQYLFNLGGKRIRPILALISGRLFHASPAPTQLISAAAGIELIHMATLLHDDIIDNAETRRRQMSAFKKFGMSPTLLAGDFLLAKAFGLCATLDRFIIQETERACIELTEGEAMEETLTPNIPYPLERYWTVARKKTASLFALSTGIGTFCANQPTELVDKMRSFGYQCGIAFQIVDDILDITASEDLLGKATGTDLRQKTPTLVNLLWLNHDAIIANEFFSIEKPTANDIKQAVTSIEQSGVIEECRSLAKTTAQGALTDLDAAAESASGNPEVHNQLRSIMEYTLERCL